MTHVSRFPLGRENTAVDGRQRAVGGLGVFGGVECITGEI